MMRLLIHELRFRVKGMIGWSIGMILFGAVYITVYPQVNEQMGDLADFALYEALGMSLGTFESYIASVVINFLPILLGIFAIVTGTKTLAGEEEDGTLELVMAQPISRFQIVSAKLLSLAVAIFTILLVAAFGDALLFASVREQSGSTLEPVRLFLVVFSAWPVTMVIASMSLFLGSFAPKRRIASMIATVYLVAGYFAETLSGMVPSLKNVRFLSIFNYFDSTAAVFTEGVEVSDLIVLFSTVVLFYALTLLCFGSRNITVGEWPWRRAKNA